MIQRVHIIFKTHLDVGFTDFARNVVAEYMQRYIPAALTLAEELAHEAGPERFIWTTGSWLIYHYLEQASPGERARLEAAIAAGYVAWHALPFTTHSELMDPRLFRAGLSLSAELDRRFGKRTVAAKMTDVPGHTRGIVPLLAEAGVKLLHIGVNGSSTPPRTPPIFRWCDPSGAEVIVILVPGGYGGVTTLPGGDEALSFSHTSDNLGPPSRGQVLDDFRAARERFPAAHVTASTLDAFVPAVLAARDRLPVVTSELGDTWIHGVGSDPKKVSQFRELLRLRDRWLAEGLSDAQRDAISGCERALLLVAEHTWGLDIKTHLADWENYAADAFRAARPRPAFRKVEASWAEQRAYLQDAVAALGDAHLAGQAEQALRRTEPARPDLTGFHELADPRGPFAAGRFQLAFDERGCLSLLDDRVTGRSWASPAHPLGLFGYETFSAADYDRFYRQYIINKRLNRAWAAPDFTKPGLAGSGALHGEWTPQLSRLLHRQDGDAHTFLALLALPEEASVRYGCPREVVLEVAVRAGRPRVDFTLQWFAKPACRLPEAFWFTFAPTVSRSGRWLLDKMGQWVSPRAVICDGNRKLHAVNTGVLYREPRAALFLETLDAPLVAPGERSLLDFNNRQPAAAGGMHFLLYNNVWGTNFPMWYDEDARFRFALQLVDAPSHSTSLPPAS